MESIAEKSDADERIPFDLSMMNNINREGLPNKTLSVFLVGKGVGKSLMMRHGDKTFYICDDDTTKVVIDDTAAK